MDRETLINWLHVRLFGSSIDSLMDTVFVFGRAHGDWEGTEGDSGILLRATELLRQFLTCSICIPGTRGGATHNGPDVATAYPGSDAWQEYLHGLGANPNKIFVTQPSDPHTRGESDSFVAECKARHWTSVAFITQPHQTLRSMLAMVKSMAILGHTMRVVPLLPRTVNWQKVVHGSQGANPLPRIEHIQIECQKTLEGQREGWLATFEELYAYFQTF